MPTSDPFASLSGDSEPRAFVLRIRLGAEGADKRMVVSVDDVVRSRKTHFPTLEAAFAEIREALNQPDNLSG